MNESHISKRRDFALRQTMGALLEYQPTVVYLCPTKGVNINLIPLILVHEIPLRLVFPAKHFFTNLTGTEKDILDAACTKADKIIILDESKTSPMDWAEDWYKGSERAIDSSDWILIARNQVYESEPFAELCLKFDGCTKPVLVVGIEPED